MKKIIILILAFGINIISFAQQSTGINYNQYFTAGTMRVDYFHTGTSSEEHFSLDRILNDGDWAGSETVLLDGLDRGLLLF